MTKRAAILRAAACGCALVFLAVASARPVGAARQNAPTPASPAIAASQLAEVIAAVRDVSTMRADFLQIDSNGQRVSGVLTLKRPGKFRFQYEPSYPLLIVADGRSLVMIDYAVRQVQRWPLHYTPIGALLDPRHDISRLAQIGPSSDANVVNLLIHDRGHRENGDMWLTFLRNGAAPGGWEIAGWETVDAQNNRTIVRLAHQQYGVEVADALFTWLDPRKHAQR
jgi:outer membrane lipoprotein-sorting protein